jgi:hypothetical protein
MKSLLNLTNFAKFTLKQDIYGFLVKKPGPRFQLLYNKNFWSSTSLSKIKGAKLINLCSRNHFFGGQKPKKKLK